MTVRVDVQPAVLEWARARSGVPDDAWATRFDQFDAWMSGERQPTLKQLEDFGRRTHTPLGFLLLDEPPVEEVPIPDFRTIGDDDIAQPSADLLDTIYLCQQRQEWYRDHARINGEDPLPFVGSAVLLESVQAQANRIEEQLRWSSERRAGFSTWDAALAGLRQSAEDAGVLVMISGIVGSDTHRALDPSEFRGFALADPYAPVIFVNGADTKAAQVFTLVHELAHLWLGESGLSDLDRRSVESIEVERWCNSVAAEVLVPLDEFRRVYDAAADLTEQLDRLARRFKVSTLVILGRVREAGFMTWEQFRVAFDAELQRVLSFERPDSGSGGGDFYNTLFVHVSRRFADAVVTSTLEGHTLYRDTFQMLGFRKQATFDTLVERLGAE